MMSDACECLAYVTNQCLLSLNELIMIGRVSEDGKARLTLEYTETQVKLDEWPPLFWKVGSLSVCLYN